VRRWFIVIASTALFTTHPAGAGQTATTAPERSSVIVDGHPIAVWSRVPQATRASVLLVHGRTWSSRPDFDLQVPGLERSVMRSLARRGIAAYAVDLRGYGATPRDPSGWLTPRRAADDVVQVLAWIRSRHQSLAPPALVGWSRGGAVAALAAQRAPASVSALVLFGFVWDPDADFASIPDPAGDPARLPNSAAAAASDFISPQVTPRAVIRAFVDQALRADPTLVDVKSDREFADLNPATIRTPTLILFGERDPGVTMRDARTLLGALAASQKRIEVLRRADHAAQLEDTHERWVDVVASFVTAR
jgi:pimeloyl-ACP methyl ester carboxylesterase